jgi:cytidyltransferase-like protein
MKKIVLCTGGFDPIHSGHINYLKSAKQLGDMLIVGLNSDEWLERKKGRAFMPWNERLCVVNNLAMVDEVYTFDDEDGSARHFIQQVRAHYPDAELIFANGGDRTAKNIPEMDVADSNLRFEFGVGGDDKKNSSSWILEEWRSPKTQRPWGYYKVLHNVGKQVKLKELTVDPGKSLSMQRHKNRAEFWFVSEGEATVYTLNRKTDAELLGKFTKFNHIWIDNDEWHQLCNETNEPLRIIEIQYGNDCSEEDIERQ